MERGRRRFSSWGRVVAKRYREGAPSTAEAEEKEREFRREAKDVIGEFGRAITALGRTFSDRQANEELSSAVGAVGDAITATANEVVAGIRSSRDTKD